MSFTLPRRSLLAGSAALGVLTSASLTGCGGSGPAATVSGSGEFPTYTRYAGVTPDLEGTEDGIPPAFFTYPDSPTKAIEGTPGDGEPVTLMAQSSEPIPPSMDQNKYWQELNDRIGSEFQIAITPANDYDAKFATVMTGDDLPDIFQVSRGANSVPQMLQAKAVDLSEHLSGDAIANYPMLANIPTESWQNVMLDGKIMAVPIPRGVMQCTILYQRQDLLDSLGIDSGPKNFEELLDLATEVTDERGNVWAFTSAPGNYIQQMLAVPNVWSYEGGELTRSYEHPQMKEALEATRKVVEAGVVVPDSFASNSAQYKQWFMAGTAYFTGDSYSAWPAYLALGKADDFALSAIDMVGFDGGRGALWRRSPTHSIVALNKSSAERTETLLSIMNWLAAPFGTEEYLFRKFGVDGVHYEMDGGDPVPNPETQGELYLGQQYIADAPMVLYHPGSEQGIRREHEHMLAVIPESVPDPTEGMYSETDTRKGGQISKAVSAMMDEIVQGRRPVADFDTAVADWKAAGGDAIRDEYLALLAGEK
ncbi:ABC transporter substrate-binding protein [Brachybacterium ginsengisoli]|uniref:ABC transporter substrate-binding protein n=1 Tax=Brachybacterium ginsengisoli TaxID=1331682 RepID=A0A291GTZ9_9MICO|nr:extracellular solute-binding protein [Brachybacterium ginsengisoli]ATG53586.1 ABC transporter substrate-binding protein [Brachybacterium ginsengisoli]